MKDGYTVNYVAFLEDIEANVRYFDSKRLIDLSGDLKQNYPGFLIDVELPKLARPEIGKLSFGKTMNLDTSFHPALRLKREPMNVDEVLKRIKRHLLDHPIKLEQFFQGFDHFNTGFITRSQFIRGLDTIGVSGLQKLCLLPQEIQAVASFYETPEDSSRVNWCAFVDDVRSVYGVKNLHKNPELNVEVPPEEIMKLPKQGAQNWDCVSKEWQEICQDAVFKIRATVTKRRLEIEPLFQDFDR